MKYAFIKAHSSEYKVVRLLSVLGVSSSGYYDWRDRPTSKRCRADQSLVIKIRSLHKKSRYTYGSPRLHQDLLAEGIVVGIKRVARLMREHGIQSKMRRKFVITTDSRNTAQPAPNLLKRNFKTMKPDIAWVSDTTFIQTRQGWLYLAMVMDLFSRKVIGWSMGNKNDTSLVLNAATMAVARTGKSKNILLHSDQGSTYASKAYQLLLKKNKMIPSMSRKGECLDNAVAESFFGTLKTELVDHEDYKTKEEAKKSLFEYIEIFYNRQRRHSYLGYLSPDQYERQNAPQ